MHPGGSAVRKGWYYRIHAALLARFGKKYEHLVAERKRSLMGGLQGRVVEIGAGAGVNLCFLSNGVEWYGVDPNIHLKPYVEKEAARQGRSVEFLLGVAESLPFPDESADAVIGTLTLCSVSDPERALAEIRRVLRPGGTYVFVEHVAAPPGTRTRRRQNWICPVWRRLADGCHPNRDTGAAIEAAGFAQVSREHFRLDLPIAGPHISGMAIK